MMTADEFVESLLAVLGQHISRTGTVGKATKKLGIGRTTAYQFLSGDVDVGILKAFKRAQKLGLPPGPWIRETGIFPEQGTYSQRLRGLLSLGAPEDPLLSECERFIRQIRLPPPSSLHLPEIILTIEDVHLGDPSASAALAKKCLKNKLRQLRKSKRERAELTSDDLLEFYSLVATYGLCRHRKAAPRDWAWSVAFALDYMQPYGSSPPLTWLLVDGSMVLRRLFKADESLEWALSATRTALIQDLGRLYPRALLTLASVLFARGEYRIAASIDQEVMARRQDNPYKPLAAYSGAVALARVAPKEAAQLLDSSREQLDRLPAHRQMQRFWTEARVLAELKENERAFEAYIAAIEVGDDNADPRDFFLIFDEARLLVGIEDHRLQPIADQLHYFLPRMSFQFPDEFYAGQQYLRYFSEKEEGRMRKQISIITAAD